VVKLVLSEALPLQRDYIFPAKLGRRVAQEVYFQSRQAAALGAAGHAQEAIDDSMHAVHVLLLRVDHDCRGFTDFFYTHVYSMVDCDVDGIGGKGAACVCSERRWPM